MKVNIRRLVKEAREKKKLLLGTRSVTKAVKVGEVESIYVSSNCPERIKRYLKYYKKRFNINVVELKENSKTLGEVCGKPFNVLVMGIKK